MSTKETLKDLNLTKDEVDRFTEAFKKPEFRDMIIDYAKELQDPENRALYESEIAKMEAEQGNDVQFLHPSPGFVLKFKLLDSEEKLFVNICSNEHIGAPVCSRMTQGSSSGLNWSVPHSFAPVKQDTDKKGGKCKVVDTLFNPDALRMAETNARFKKLLSDIAVEGIMKNFELKIDQNSVRYPKLKFKGVPQATVLRKKTDENAAPTQNGATPQPKKHPVQEKVKQIVTESKAAVRAAQPPVGVKEAAEDSATHKKSPRVTVTYTEQLDIQNFATDLSVRTGRSRRPSRVNLAIELPGIKRAAEVDLTCLPRKVELRHSEYELDLALEYPVDECNGSAKFDKSRSVLTLSLPIVQSLDVVVTPRQPLEDSSLATLLPQSGDQPRPLIEMLPDPVEVVPSASEESTAPAGDPEQQGDSGVEEDITRHPTGSLCALSKQEENADTVTLEFSCKHIEKKSLKLSHQLNHQGGSDVSVYYSCSGQGGFPLDYSALVRTPANCPVRDLDSMAGFTYLRLTLTKSAAGLWNACQFGLTAEALEHRDLVNKSTLESTAADEDDDPSPAGNDSSALTELFDVFNHSVVSAESEPSEEISEEEPLRIEVVCEPVEVNPILKRVSVSECEDVPAPVSTRQKNVSFSEKLVDEMMYRCKDPPTSVHKVMKGRRKHERKKAERTDGEKVGRRRTSSNSSSGDSCELESPRTSQDISSPDEAHANVEPTKTEGSESRPSKKEHLMAKVEPATPSPDPSWVPETALSWQEPRGRCAPTTALLTNPHMYELDLE